MIFYEIGKNSRLIWNFHKHNHRVIEKPHNIIVNRVNVTFQGGSEFCVWTN
jgi:hypothetical protein